MASCGPRAVMKKSSLQSSIALSLFAAVALPQAYSAESIERSTITQVVRDVAVLTPAAKAKKSAKVNDVFTAPEIIKTGADSRAEMVAPDQTVTRVGANTLFSFEPQSREINLQKGSVLFNSPSGKGGGTIKTAAATASVLGTTLIVVTTQNGGFKALLLEGHGVVKSNGKSRSLTAGQMVYVLPGGVLSGVLNFHLAEQVGVARLVTGFKAPLPSQEKIEAAVAKQEAQIAKGQLVTTGLLASDSPTQAFKVDNTVARDVNGAQERSAQRIANSAQAGITDAVIAQPQLQMDRVFTAATGAPDFLSGGGVAADFLPPDYSIYIARNTTVRTPTIDLSPYPNTFLFYSTGDFIVEQSVSITGGTESVDILTLGTLKLAPGAYIDIDAGNASIFVLGANVVTDSTAPLRSPLVITGGGIRTTGNLSLFASDFDLERGVLVAQGGSIVASALLDFKAVGLGANAPQFIAPQSISLFAGRDMDISRSVFSTLDTNLDARNNLTLDTVAFLTAGGPALNTTLSAGNNLDLSTVAFRSQNVSLDAQKMRLTQVGFFPGTTVPGSASLTASGAMQLVGVNFQMQSVALEARTMALTNVAFAARSSVTLRSQTGLLALRPNTGRPVELGKVNFIQNVTYGGKPAQNFIDRGITLTK